MNLPILIGTACAIPRLMICILENFQTKEGLVNIPEVLQKYCFGLKTIGLNNKDYKNNNNENDEGKDKERQHDN